MREYQTIQDFIEDDSFINYVLKKSQKDIDFWDEYTKKYPSKRQVVFKARQEVLDIQDALYQLDAEDNYRRLEPLLMEVGEKENSAQFSWLRIAAASVAVVLLSSVAAWLINLDNAEDTTAYFVNPSQRKIVTLVDGTVVKLNADSKLEVSSGFGQSNRKVSLEGEAYLEVTKNKELPLVVSTPAVEVRVLGTTLNIRAYANEEFVETSLLEGEAEVILKNKEMKTITLEPMKKVVALTSTVAVPDVLSTSDETIESGFLLEPVTVFGEEQHLAETSWTDQKLIFVNEPLSSIAKTLERWYNVQIEFEHEELKNRKYNASFDESEELSRVLKSLSKSISFTYKKTGKRTISIGK